MASVLTYNGFPFEDNEANLVGVSKRAVYSERSRKLQQTVEWDVVGEIQKSTVGAIITRIAAIEQALSNDGGDATYAIDGVVAHRLSANSASGTRVVYASFPRGDAAELATKRTFSFKLRATYDATSQPGGDDLVSWQESISIEGDGGPWVVTIHEMPGIQSSGGPVAYVICPRTLQYYQQTGMAVGYNSYPVPPGPVNPAGHFGYLQRISYGSGRQTGNGIHFFTTRWSYRQYRDIAVFGGTDYKPTSK